MRIGNFTVFLQLFFTKDQRFTSFVAMFRTEEGLHDVSLAWLRTVALL